MRPMPLTICTTRWAVSFRNTPTVRISDGSRFTMSPTRAGDTCRGEGAKMNPMASAPMATASSASSSLVVPQIFTNMETSLARYGDGTRDRSAAPGSAAVTSVSPTRMAS